MATVVRNTGTHFRYDSDKNVWEAKMRLKTVEGNKVSFKEFLTEVATLIELIVWISDILAGLTAVEGVTVEGAPDVAGMASALHAL